MSPYRSFVPRPVYAVLQLFPVSEPYEKERKARDEQAKHDQIPKDMMFFKQTVREGSRHNLSLLSALLTTPLLLHRSAMPAVYEHKASLIWNY